MLDIPSKQKSEYVYFGRALNWENIPKPKEIAHLPRCVICRLAVNVQKQTNIYCWNCWKICIRPDRRQQYENLKKYAMALASKDPSFHGKYSIGKERPVLVVRVGSEGERDTLFLKILEDLKDRNLYPKDDQKRWYRRGCSSFNAILGKWKQWQRPTTIKNETIYEILQISMREHLDHLTEW